MSAGIAVANQARQHPNELATFDELKKRTWAELDIRTNQLANLLYKKYGIVEGDRVALLCPNRLQVIEVLAATHKAGAVYVGLNFRMTDNDITAALINATPKLIIGAGEFNAEGSELAKKNGIAWLNLDDESQEGYEQLLLNSSTEVPTTIYSRISSDSACIVYTSGTTGAPKGVLFSHGAMMQHATVACLEYEINSMSRYLIQIPHNSSVNITMMPCLVAGAAIGFSDNRNFDPSKFVATISKHQITHTFLVPTHLMRILDSDVDLRENVKSLTTLGYGSSPISPDRLRSLIDMFGPIFIQLYGMAEIASIGTLLRKKDHVRALNDEPRLLRSAGQPSIAMSVRVVNEDFNDVKPGERGEVIFRGPHMMDGYNLDIQRTNDTMLNGWIRSGDIAEIDDYGYIYIVDRIKNIIIRGGQNIAPVDIENIFYRHPDVSEVAVVGAPDIEWGEKIVAVVSRRAGSSISELELLNYVAGELPRFLHPELVMFVDELPKNAVGKIDKNAVRSPMWNADRKV